MDISCGQMTDGDSCRVKKSPKKSDSFLNVHALFHILMLELDTLFRFRIITDDLSTVQKSPVAI